MYVCVYVCVCALCVCVCVCVCVFVCVCVNMKLSARFLLMVSYLPILNFHLTDVTVLTISKHIILNLAIITYITQLCTY